MRVGVEHWARSEGGCARDAESTSRESLMAVVPVVDACDGPRLADSPGQGREFPLSAERLPEALPYRRLLRSLKLNAPQPARRARVAVRW